MQSLLDNIVQTFQSQPFWRSLAAPADHALGFGSTAWAPVHAAVDKAVRSAAGPTGKRTAFDQVGVMLRQWNDQLDRPSLAMDPAAVKTAKEFVVVLQQHYTREIAKL